MYSKEELCRLEQAELVKLIDEGQLVYLPCKVGDTVYSYSIVNDTIFEMRVGDMFPHGHIVKGILCNYYLVNDYTYKCVTVYDFGKTVFLTREEAEKALKERE